MLGFGYFVNFFPWSEVAGRDERGQTLKDYDSPMSFKIFLTSLSSM